MENLRIQDIFVKAKEAYEKNDLKSAQLFLTEVIEAQPNYAEAFFLLGNIFHLKGELGKAIKAFNRVLELDPKHTDASISLSVILNDIGRYDEAKTIFEKANQQIKLKPGGGGLAEPHINKKFSLKHYELAEMYMSYQRWDEALFEYNKTTSLDPDFLEARIKVAKAYAKKGFISKASEELRRLRLEHPSFLPARIALGILLYGQGNVVEAQAEWSTVIERDPAHSEAKMYLELSRGASETRV